MLFQHNPLVVISMLKKKDKNNNQRIIIEILVVGVIIFFALKFNKFEALSDFTAVVRQANAYKCPDDYATEKEQMTAMNNWTNEYYDNHPGATLSDWSIARYKFWVDNKCEKAIERYNEAKNGKADLKTMNFIKETIVNNN